MSFDNEVLCAARQVISLGSDGGLTVGTAESCTGGLVAGALTAVPGSSEVVLGGVVSYACSVKHRVLGVEQDVLDGVGAVSRECAGQMAEGARRALGCDVAVSVTGIAGPGGAEPGKPVGTVWFGLATPRGTQEHVCHLAGDRDGVRREAVLEALSLLRDGLVETSQAL